MLVNFAGAHLKRKYTCVRHSPVYRAGTVGRMQLPIEMCTAEILIAGQKTICHSRAIYVANSELIFLILQFLILLR